MAQLQPNPAADNALAQSILGAKIVSPAAPLTLNFSLGCVLSEVVIDMYLWYVPTDGTPPTAAASSPSCSSATSPPSQTSQTQPG